MASTALLVALDIVSNPRVQDTAVKAFDAVYSRIFKKQSDRDTQSTIDVKPMSSDQQMIVDRLSAIELRLQNMPSDIEMAMAFSALQAELRVGQKRLWFILLPLFAVNFAILAVIYLQR